MELNREQIIKALECCYIKKSCENCPYECGNSVCIDKLERDTLSLITEENERLRAENEIKSQKRANIFEIANAYERGQADTVRKMLDIMAENATNNYPRTVRLDVVERKAKEMLEGACAGE
ncbi:MAG: hypothetical protein IKA64_01945 [Clostridia bacterium]|nr:hypothetical protein [Clostridia bacterium]